MRYPRLLGGRVVVINRTSLAIQLFKFAALPALIVFSQALRAQLQLDAVERIIQSNPYLALGLAEGVFAVNAWLASKDPQVYGGLVALLTPLAIRDLEKSSTVWVGLAAVEVLAIYNYDLQENEYSEAEVLRKNMFGWHAVAGAIGLTYWLNNRSGDNESLSLRYQPLTDGGRLKLAYRF